MADKRIVRTRNEFWIGRIGPKQWPATPTDDPEQDGFVFPYRKAEPYGVREVFAKRKPFTEYTTENCGMSETLGAIVLNTVPPTVGVEATGGRAVGFYGWMAPVDAARKLIEQPNPWFTATRADTNAPIPLTGCSRLRWDEIGNGTSYVPGNFVALGTEDCAYTTVLASIEPYRMPRNPSINLHIIRYPIIPASGHSSWAFTFGKNAAGQGFTLSWGLDTPNPLNAAQTTTSAFLRFPDGTYEAYPLTPDQCVTLGTAEEQEVAIYCVNGDLLIHLMKINLVWRVPAYRVRRTLPAQRLDIPSSGIELRYTGGYQIVNITAMKFLASGQLVTRGLDHGYPFDTSVPHPDWALPEGGSPGAWPSPVDANGDTSVVVTAQTVKPPTDPGYDPARICYKAVLTARETTPGCGWSYWTPILAMATALHYPVEVEPTNATWYPIDDFVDYPNITDGPEGEVSYGAPSTMTIPLNLYARNRLNGLTWKEQLESWDPTLLTGTIAGCVRYGYEYDDGSVVTYPLITGEIAKRTDSGPIGEKRTASLSLTGWGAWLQNQMVWAPGALGYKRAVELYNYLVFAGIPLSRILIDERLKTDDTVVEMDTAGLPYADPPLVPSNGTTAQALVEERGVWTHLTCYEDGEKMVIAKRDPERPTDSSVPITLYSAGNGADADIALSCVEIDADTAATANRHWREGKTVDGREIIVKQDEYRLANDPTSGKPVPGDLLYRGRIINVWDRDDSHFSQSQINSFQQEAIEWTVRRKRKIVLTSKSGEALWDQWLLHMVTPIHPTLFPYLNRGTWTLGYDPVFSYYDPRDEVLASDGKYYLCTAEHLATESTQPGVGADWQTVWEPAPVFRITNLHFKLTLSRNYITLTAEER